MRRRHLLSAALTSAWVAPARSQDYPSRSVRVIVGFPPGGGTDLVARPLVQRLRSVLGQSGVVENRAGANGTIGLDAVAKSPPDGYTIGHVNSSVVVTNPLLYRNLPLNVATDIVPVCIVNESAAVIVVPEDVPARNLQEFVALARSQPGRFSFGSGGLGSGDHLGFELFRRATGVQILHVPYRGGGPALQDMMGGRIQMMISSFGMYRSQVEAGNLKVLAIFSRERQSYLPDVPTAVEQGWPDLIVPSWQGIVAPAQTPPAVIARLEEAYRSAVADPEVKELFASFGSAAVFRGQQEMARSIQEDRARWSSIIREAEIRLD
jgi:tripartite-type tricarboxylate transporter receptor subunit TctC